MAVAASYSSDDRQAIGLLMMPFLVFAIAIGSSQSMRWQPSSQDQIAAPVPFARPQTPLGPSRVDTAVENFNGVTDAPPMPAVALEPGVPDTLPTLSSNAASAAQSPAELPPAPILNSPSQVIAETLPAAAKPLEAVEPFGETIGLAASPPDLTPEMPVSTAGQRAQVIAEALPAAAAPADVVEPAVKTIELAALPPNLAPVIPVPAAEPPTAAPGNACTAEMAKPAVASAERLAALGGAETGGFIEPIAFGMELAGAAREQLDDFTVYTDKYRTIAYPNGDVPQFYGVCTDVIIRAYRVLGIDLQALVHQSKLGSGDTNIDHRRVTTLQKFFTAYGQSIPVSEFSEDYWPGDIVSYYRPQNAHSRTHIAVVSDIVGPSGNFMIIHNRGWGPQQEDALFVDQITGHYRYSAAKRPAIAPKAPGAAAIARNRSKKTVPANPKLSAAKPSAGALAAQ